MSNKAFVQAKLELAAALARSLAMDYANGRLWPGDLERQLAEIQAALNEAIYLAKEDR